MLKQSLIGIAICALATSALAQTPKLRKYPKPAVTEAKDDTLNMSCAQASALVTKSQGIVLKTGPNRWDRYVNSAAACVAGDHDLTPQFVKTKDNSVCHIGFTCEDKGDTSGGGD